MSSREKKLLSILVLAGFLMVNFFLYSQYLQKKTIYQTQLDTAKNELQQAIFSQENAYQYAEQMQWLIDNEPPPTDAQTVQAQLQSSIEKEALNFGLTIKSQEPITTDTSGIHYHRAQHRFVVTGREDSLYRWLTSLNDPNAFRAVTLIRLNPNTQEDTLIDCNAVFSQWFIPDTTDL